MKNLIMKKLVIILVFSCIALIMTACEAGDGGSNSPAGEKGSGNRVGSESETVVKKTTPAACFKTDDIGMLTSYENKYKDVSGEEKDCPKAVVIPATLQGKAITAIGEGAFIFKALTEVTIPDSVTTIVNSAFGFNALTEVTIPANVTTISEHAFTENEMASLTLGEKVETIGASAFQYNKLTEVTIPDSVTTIEPFAFRDNQLTSVEIPNNVTMIGSYTFANNKLTSITIPNSVTSISNDAFSENKDADGNDTIKEVVIDPNPNLDLNDDAFPHDFKTKFDAQKPKQAGTWTLNEEDEWIFAVKQ